MKKQIMSNVNSIYKSFKYACKGLMFCIRNERNMRIHISMGMIVLLVSYVLKLDEVKSSILIICIGITISFEMVNTAIEHFINLKIQHYSKVVKVIKDVAAGAVLISAIISFIVGLKIFLTKANINTVINIMLQNPFLTSITLTVGILFIYVFIFYGDTLLIKNILRGKNGKH